MLLIGRRISWLPWLSVGVALTMLSGCGVNVRLADMPMPDAAVEPYPLTAGLRFGDNIEAFTYEETLPSGATYTIDLGNASAQVFIETFEDMFERIVVVPPGEDPPPGLDLLVQPSLVALEFATPAQTVTEDYAVWIRYKIQVYDGAGKEQALYSLSAYGKSLRESAMGGSKAALSSAAEQALRDAGVLLLTRFDKDAGLADRQLADLMAPEIPPLLAEPLAETPSAPPSETESSESASASPTVEKFL